MQGCDYEEFNIYPTPFKVNTHVQYTMIMTLCIELENQWVRREKKGMIAIHALGELDYEEDDFDKGVTASNVVGP